MKGVLATVAFGDKSEQVRTMDVWCVVEFSRNVIGELRVPS